MVTDVKCLSAYCDVCRASCYGIRCTCMDCIDNASSEARFNFNTVDFCKLSCSEATVKVASVNKPHDASHDILKMRTVCQDRDRPSSYRRAKAAIAACRAQFSHVSQQHPAEGHGANKTVIEITAANLTKRTHPILISPHPKYLLAFYQL